MTEKYASRHIVSQGGN